MTSKRKSALRAILLALSVTILLAGCSGKPEEVSAPELLLSATEASVTVPVTEETLPEGQMEYQGEVYQLRDDLTTLLIMGLDKYEHTEQEIGYLNNLQSDFLMLAVLDKEANTCELLHLNRDTMTEIRRLGIGGGVADKYTGQLALAHTHGSGGSDSAINAMKAVSTLLGGVKIDHYITLTMNAVGVINDALGGVTVTVLQDFGDTAPHLKKGEEVTLMGEDALLYVRGRKGVGDQSNLDRMERQRQYLEAFYEKLMETTREEDDFLTKTMWKMSEDFTTDCSTTALDKLWDEMSQAQLQPIRTIEGKAVKGEEFMEFYVDEDDLQKTITELFCEKLG